MISSVLKPIAVDSVKIWIPGRGVGKARPRFNSRGVVHTAGKYGSWKASAIAHLKKIRIPSDIPKPCKIDCQFVNFKSSDADNLIGSVMDALVQAEIIGNDSSSYVAACSGKFVQWKKQRGSEQQQGILVEISPAEIEKQFPPECRILGF